MIAKDGYSCLYLQGDTAICMHNSFIAVWQLPLESSTAELGVNRGEESNFSIKLVIYLCCNTIDYVFPILFQTLFEVWFLFEDEEDYTWGLVSLLKLHYSICLKPQCLNNT